MMQSFPNLLNNQSSMTEIFLSNLAFYNRVLLLISFSVSSLKSLFEAVLKNFQASSINLYCI